MVLEKYLKKMIRGIVRWAISEETKTRDYSQEAMPVSISGSLGASKAMNSSNNININGMNFTIYTATGGKVVEFKTYDPRTDRSVNTLYVITDKEDLGEELGQIITKESLCR